MVRRIELFVPPAHVKEVLEYAHAYPHAHSVSHTVNPQAPHNALIIFRAKEKHLGSMIHQLGQMGMGTRYGNIDIMSLEMTKPRLPPSSLVKAKKKKYRWDDRKTFEEIYEAVDSDCHLTFDYLVQITVASIICGCGLLSDSATLVVASMLVSPLMGPILGLTFGLTVRDTAMTNKSMRNEVCGVILTLFVGMLIGATICWLGPVDDLTTAEMTNRGTFTALLTGVAVAIPSGVGVAIAVTSEGASALVGVAISASLLPPIVNSGINLMWFVVQKYRDNGLNGEAHLVISAYSMALFIINWILICIFALLTFRIKKLRPVDIDNAAVFMAPKDNLINGEFKDRRNTQTIGHVVTGDVQGHDTAGDALLDRQFSVPASEVQDFGDVKLQPGSHPPHNNNNNLTHTSSGSGFNTIE